jgi:Tfp pilus assembly protein FimT
MIELAVVLVVAMMMVTAAATYSIPWLAKEEMRGAVYEVQTHLQLARIQAVTRNSTSRFILDAANRRLQVFDLVDTGNSADDILLADVRLPDTLVFARPDSGSVITLTAVSTDVYGATFESDGSVSAGAGVICMRGGESFDRLTLHAAGGVRVERWADGAWTWGA